MTGWRVHAWVLMSNHYYLLIETPSANLVNGMSWLQNAYTRRFNTRHQMWGRLFGDRYKAVAVQGDDPNYFGSLLDYVHLNPVRAGMVRPSEGESVGEFDWSSLAGGYLLPPSRRPRWFEAGMGLATFGCADTAVGRKRFVRRLDSRAVSEEMEHCGEPASDSEQDARVSRLGRGWYWGSREFAEEQLGANEKAIEEKKGRSHRYSEEKRCNDEREAERIVSAAEAAAGLNGGDWQRMSGADARKVSIADLVWRRTTVSQAWICERLHMSSTANVSQQLRRWKQSPKRKGLPQPLQDVLSTFDT